MDRVIVTSSNVKSVGYDPDTQTLEVEFFPGKDGIPRVYQYDPIDVEHYEAIIDPNMSAGRLVGQIKADPSVRCVRVEVAA